MYKAQLSDGPPGKVHFISAIKRHEEGISNAEPDLDCNETRGL